MSYFGAVPSDKLAAFSSVVRAEAEKCFAATLLKRDVDRQRADEVIVAAAQAVSEAKATTDASKAKKAIDGALAKALDILPQIKEVANLSAIRQAATDAKKGIDERAAARRTTAPVPGPIFDPSLESSPAVPPVVLAGAAAVAVLLLWPRR